MSLCFTFMSGKLRFYFSTKHKRRASGSLPDVGGNADTAEATERGRVGPEDGSEYPAQAAKHLFFSSLRGLKANLQTGKQGTGGKYYREKGRTLEPSKPDSNPSPTISHLGPWASCLNF